ncbi:MAG: HDOD domain-containing protein [Lachnospiraceae bacterium]|nr:HDOD domain-containing protein [Lachnospiraceae bacterium]
MLVTLIPLFDENLNIGAYSLFVQKENVFLNPSLLGTGRFDGAARVEGLEIIQNMGIESLSSDKEVFVTVTNMSIFSDLSEQCDAPHERLVLLVDPSVKPEPMYIERISELKKQGYKLAIRKLQVAEFEAYREILKLTDYVFLNHKKIDISKAKIYFTKLFPQIRLCAVGVDNQEEFAALKSSGGYQLYEGDFYRIPMNRNEHEVAPLKVNYIELLNTVNNDNFELTQAADIISRDTALTISLLRMVNRMAINSEITSIRHAAAMLGQKELKKWITTAVVGELCADKPNEITRLSLLRARFAENLAGAFGLAMQASELFLMGLFSVLDVILDKPMEEALSMVHVSKQIRDVLVDRKGPLLRVYEFILQYESANWQEVSRQMILEKIDMSTLYDAYIRTLVWYRKLTLGR